MSFLTIQDKPYLNTNTCEVPESVPTKWLLYSTIGFFFVTTAIIIAFIRYDTNRTVLKSHHDAEISKLVTELEQYKKLLETRTKESDNRAALFLESIKKIDPKLEDIKTSRQDYTPPKRLEWKQVREPVQLEGGIDDGYELIEIK
jgi:hypothetical protein